MLWLNSCLQGGLAEECPCASSIRNRRDFPEMIFYHLTDSVNFFNWSVSIFLNLKEVTWSSQLLFYTYFSYFYNWPLVPIFIFCLIFLTYSKNNFSCYIECFFVKHSVSFLEQSEFSFNILKLITAQIHEGLHSSHYECARICTQIWRLSWPIVAPELQVTPGDRPIPPSADLRITADHKLKSITVKPCQSQKSWVSREPCEPLRQHLQPGARHTNLSTGTAVSCNCHFCSPNRGFRALSL